MGQVNLLTSTNIYHENQGFMWVNKGTPPKTNMDTQNDGLESRYLKLAIFLYQFVRFLECKYSQQSHGNPRGIPWAPDLDSIFHEGLETLLVSDRQEVREHSTYDVEHDVDDDGLGWILSEKERSVLWAPIFRIL